MNNGTTHSLTVAGKAIVLLSLVALAAFGDTKSCLNAYSEDYTSSAPQLPPFCAKCEYNIGVEYYNGTGRPQNYEFAYQHFLLAGGHGYPDAQNALGLMYLNGFYLPHDRTAAEACFSLAARQGNVDGLFHYGVLLEEEGDLVEAHEYYNLAGVRGNADAMEKRDKLARLMTPSQVHDAQTLASAWTPFTWTQIRDLERNEERQEALRRQQKEKERQISEAISEADAFFQQLRYAEALTKLDIAFKLSPKHQAATEEREKILSACRIENACGSK